MIKELMEEQEIKYRKCGIGRISEKWEISVAGEKIIDVRSPKSLLDWIEKELKPEVGELPITVIRLSTEEKEVF